MAHGAMNRQTGNSPSLIPGMHVAAAHAGAPPERTDMAPIEELHALVSRSQNPGQTAWHVRSHLRPAGRGRRLRVVDGPGYQDHPRLGRQGPTPEYQGARQCQTGQVAVEPNDDVRRV